MGGWERKVKWIIKRSGILQYVSGIKINLKIPAKTMKDRLFVNDLVKLLKKHYSVKQLEYVKSRGNAYHNRKRKKNEAY